MTSSEAAKIVFGPEPKDYEVYAFLLQNESNLEFSPTVDTDKTVETKMNPKRMQRQVSRQLSAPGAGTKAQQALKLQQEGKKERLIKNGLQRDLDEQRKFMLRQEKKKEKHKGR